MQPFFVISVHLHIFNNTVLCILTRIFIYVFRLLSFFRFVNYFTV
ncbi:hypothetical protein CLOHYLEM_05679 [[Clostridium] hylemonae DSM 15053]|uniref:Uncharacterized protein n=1 Tax=[Clostridium] hylemonae DSM 15053 TaxID=553973 RepID=C0C0S5_9FIRM|nr:hypothetical protein CLOHYLEM_05679 [[Clostridium] hylemonae DSM 15053]